MCKKVPFTAFNFPYEGNESFAGAGSRTQYVTSKSSFNVIKDTFIHTSPTKSVHIKSDSQVFFTSPWKLYKGSDIGLSGKLSRGTFAYVSFDSSNVEPIGFINIRAIQKPSGKSQSRVSMGAAAQEQIFEIVGKLGKTRGVSVNKISSAPPSSNRPDLIINYGSDNVQFEIKGRKSPGGYITVFDKSLRREVESPQIVESVTKAYINSLEVKVNYSLDNKELLVSPITVSLKDGLEKIGYPQTFQGVVDFYKNYVDPRYGFCSDRGKTPKSGKLPTDFVTSDDNVLEVIRENIINHLIESGDDYFTVYTSGNNTAEIYSVKENNVLGMGSFPQIVSAKLATYGGCSCGATRVGFKIKIS